MADDFDIFWDKVSRLMAEHGLSETAMTQKAGLGHGYFSKLRERRNLPSPRYLRKIAEALDTTVSSLIDNGPSLTERPQTFEFDAPKPAKTPPREAWPMAPLYASAEGGDGDMTVTMGVEIETVHIPPELVDVRDLFAVNIIGDSMEPRYEEGEAIWVAPHHPPQLGKDALFVEIVEPGECARAQIKRLTARTTKKFVVKQYNPAKEFDLPRSKWKAMAVVGRRDRR